jgi:hypothetical protein
MDADDETVKFVLKSNSIDEALKPFNGAEMGTFILILYHQLKNLVEAETDDPEIAELLKKYPVYRDKIRERNGIYVLNNK